MNELYHWQTEVMVNLEMEELKKEIDSIRLLHDAELSNPNLVKRTAIAIGETLVKLGQRLHKNYTDLHQAYQVTSSRLSS